MMLRYSFDMEEDADLIEQAVQNVLDGGMRTADIMAPGMARCSTSVMGESIIRELEKRGGVSISAVADKKARRIVVRRAFFIHAAWLGISSSSSRRARSAFQRSCACCIRSHKPGPFPQNLPKRTAICGDIETSPPRIR